MFKKILYYIYLSVNILLPFLILHVFSDDLNYVRSYLDDEHSVRCVAAGFVAFLFFYSFFRMFNMLCDLIVNFIRYKRKYQEHEVVDT